MKPYSRDNCRDIVGTCINCDENLFNGRDWLIGFGVGNLYHFESQSLFCNANWKFKKVDSEPKATLKPVVSPELLAECTLVVTFKDGAVVEYENIRFKANRDNSPDPIVITGSTVVIENDEQTITLLSVRSFKMEFPV